MKSLSDTPQTDAAEEESFGLHNNSLSARAAGWEFARNLERELNEQALRIAENRLQKKPISSDLFAGFDPDEHELIVMDGYDDCILGVVERFGQEPIVCYNKDKVLCKLESDGMSSEEAVEFFYFNQIGAWMGDSTPCFLSANNHDLSA